MVDPARKVAFVIVGEGFSGAGAGPANSLYEAVNRMEAPLGRSSGAAIRCR